MTWRELFVRLWLFLRAHLKPQHMCPECGDVMVSQLFPAGGFPRLRGWHCLACLEVKKIERDRQSRERSLQMMQLSEPLPMPPEPHTITLRELNEAAMSVFREYNGYGLRFFDDSAHGP